MIVYASLGLVVQHDGEADDERCLCGAPHGHPTARWACTAKSSGYARILQQRGAWRVDAYASSRQEWLDRLRAGDGQPHRDAAPRADVQLRLALGAAPAAPERRLNDRISNRGAGATRPPRRDPTIPRKENS